jgi:hypothetical protein
VPFCSLVFWFDLYCSCVSHGVGCGFGRGKLAGKVARRSATSAPPMSIPDLDVALVRKPCPCSSSSCRVLAFHIRGYVIFQSNVGLVYLLMFFWSIVCYF